MTEHISIPLIVGVHISARALLSLAYPSGEEGVTLLVHMKTTCLRGDLRKREGESAPCALTTPKPILYNTLYCTSHT